MPGAVLLWTSPSNHLWNNYNCNRELKIIIIIFEITLKCIGSCVLERNIFAG